MLYVCIAKFKIRRGKVVFYALPSFLKIFLHLLFELTEEFFYFRYFRNNLVFIDLKSITNFSLKKEEDLFEYVIKLYGYDKKGNWNILKNRKNNEFFISFYAMDHFNKDNVILKDYNLPATQSLPTLSNNK